MVQFLYWRQVQERLTVRCQQAGTSYSFMAAARELWEEGRYTEAPALPAVAFDDWDLHDLDDLSARLNRLPVAMNTFFDNFEEPAANDEVADIPGLDMAPIRIAANQLTENRVRRFFTFMYVIRGAGLLVNGSSCRVLPENTVCLGAPSTVYDIAVDPNVPDTIFVYVSLSVDTVEQTLSKLLRRNNIISDFFRSGLSKQNGGYLLFSLRDPIPTRVLVRSLFHEFYGGEAFSKDACANYMELLMIHLLRLGNDYEHHVEPAFGIRGNIPILAILQYIQQNFRTASLEETAKHFHFESSYLSRQIKSHTGKNYTELVQGLRIAEARHLLSSTELSIEAVAERCGYHSADYFSRSFLAVEGLRPSVWRREARKQGKDQG